MLDSRQNPGPLRRVSPRPITLPYLGLAAALLGGCLLPSFEAVEGAESNHTAIMACGVPDKLGASCGSCIAASCCDEAQTCNGDATCRADMTALISPMAEFSDAFEPLLECMQENCDSQCNVTWGCLDRYRIPAPDGPTYPVTVQLVDFADPRVPVRDVDVEACNGVSCDTGSRAKVAGASGEAVLDLPSGFDGYFAFTGGSREGEPYVPATVKWSAPIYRHYPFAHFMMRETDLLRLAEYSQYHVDQPEPFRSGRAHLVVRVQGCLPHRYLNNEGGLSAEAAGIRISAASVAGASQFFYTAGRNGAPDPSLTATTVDGIAGAFDMPTGNIRVFAHRVDTDEEVSSVAIPLFADELGYAFLLPRPRN